MSRSGFRSSGSPCGLRAVESHSLSVLFNAFAETATAGAAKAHLIRHQRAAVWTDVDVPWGGVIRIFVNFSLHGYILTLRRVSDEVSFPIPNFYTPPGAIKLHHLFRTCPALSLIAQAQYSVCRQTI